MNREQISGRQAMWLMVIIVIGTGILFLPSLAAQTAGKDAWMTPLLANLTALLPVYIAFKLANRFPDKNFIEYLPTVTGKFIGKIIGFLYLLFFVYLSGVIVRESVVFVISSVLNRTPPGVVTAMIMLVSAYVVHSGIEVIGRVNDWLFIVIAFSIMLIIILVLKEGDINNLTPLFEMGIIPILKGTLITQSFRTEIVIFLLMLAPAINQPRETGLRSIQAVILAGILLTLTTLTNSFVFDYVEAARMNFPTFELAKVINIGNFLERFDPVVLVVWLSGSFIKIALIYLMSVLAFQGVFNLKDYRPVVLPLGIIITVLSIVEFESTFELRRFLGESWPFLAHTFQFIIPLLILLIALLRKKGQKKLKEDN